MTGPGGTPGSITFCTTTRPHLEAIIALYRAAPLQRPIEDPDRIKQMYDDSNLVLTAWVGDELVGILRGWSDGAYLGYIADLAVDPDHQRHGVGRRLLEMAINADRRVQFVLRAAPPKRTGRAAGSRTSRVSQIGSESTDIDPTW